MNYSGTFQEAFNTFKVFEVLPYKEYGKNIAGHSKTIWQILNHLIIWQCHQLKILKKEEEQGFEESTSWIHQTEPKSETELVKIKLKLQQQLKEVQLLVADLKEYRDVEVFKILVEMSNHFSFHLSEIIVLARIEKVYPQPEEMEDFLGAS